MNPQKQLETQPLRVNQKNTVEIIRVSLEKSHDQMREARQMSYIRLEIAIKASKPAMRAEIILALNQY